MVAHEGNKMNLNEKKKKKEEDVQIKIHEESE